MKALTSRLRSLFSRPAGAVEKEIEAERRAALRESEIAKRGGVAGRAAGERARRHWERVAQLRRGEV